MKMDKKTDNKNERKQTGIEDIKFNMTKQM